MSALLTIGEFSRLTHLSVKALRHYDAIGLLRPAEVDGASGYRRYATAQVPVAHVIRRFRDLDMPLDEIQAVLAAPDVDARDRAIVGHLARMERMLEQTQATVASLRALLDGGGPVPPIEYRSVPRLRAVAVRDRVGWDEAEGWLERAYADLDGVLGETSGARGGPDGALYGADFFERHVGAVVAFVPLAVEPGAAEPGAVEPGAVEPAVLESTARGRVEVVDLPAAELAVTVHEGPFGDLDQAYGALGAHVAEHVLAAEGPIREHYLEAVAGSGEPGAQRTEVCWPIRRISAS
jgi:DNA-binding transcriptional MerR regulator